MKKILILGAGIYQVPLIRAAKRMGLYTIVASIPGNYPGFPLADKVCYENTVDHEAILKIAREENVDGIVTAGTDVAVITIGRVCDALGLRGLSAEAAEIASNKLAMKSRYEEYGVRTARFRKIPFVREDYEELLEGLEFPLIFKSVDSSGSRGITRVDSPADFREARHNALENTRSDYFIAEEFIEGDEFGAQAFVQDGKVEFILPHGDYVFRGDTGVPVGHYAPFETDRACAPDVREQLEKAIAAMKLDNCAINADFIMRDGKTYVLELGGRSGATCLAELVSIYYGFDYYEKILRVALGEHVDFGATKDDSGRPRLTPNASMLLTSDRDGVILSQENRNDPSDPDIVQIQFDYAPGDSVHAFRVGPHRIGHVITKGDTLEAAVEKLHQALEHIDIRVAGEE
ncbi:ATP-grasp domain-containing protein [Hornefia butyriciproducens]|uniref:ATP-grasp domain-containing protein n=1 Tax=Hornefia butyriciproducens TaxID=2652293 RepID=UPI003F8B88D9